MFCDLLRRDHEKNSSSRFEHSLPVYLQGIFSARCEVDKLPATSIQSSRCNCRKRFGARGMKQFYGRGSGRAVINFDGRMSIAGSNTTIANFKTFRVGCDHLKVGVGEGIKVRVDGFDCTH